MLGLTQANGECNRAWLYQSSQYASGAFRDALREYSITSSMSRRGNCRDNACSETLFGSLKVEHLHGQRFVTRRQVKDETIAKLLWDNKARHSAGTWQAVLAIPRLLSARTPPRHSRRR